MHATNLLKKVLKPRNLTPTPVQSKENAQSRRSSSAGSTDPSSTRPGKQTCTCSPTTHAGSFRCRLHRRNGGGGRSHGLTPAAMPKPDSPKKPFKGSSSYTISSVDIHAPLGRSTIPNKVPPPPKNNGKHHRGKPSRLSRMAKAAPLVAADGVAAAEKLEVPDENMTGFVDESTAAANESLIRQQRCQTSADVYSFDSELYPVQHPKENEGPLSGMRSPKLTPRGSDFQCDVSEMYTRLYAAQQTTDFISSTDVDALYGTGPKTKHTKVSTLRDRRVTADAIDEDWIPVFDSVPEVVEESKLYVEPLRIIDFKQHFFPESTCTSFLVQWENLSVRDATWESAHFIGGYPQLLKEFLQRRSEQGDSVEFFLAMENVKNLKGSVGGEDHNKHGVHQEADAVGDTAAAAAVDNQDENENEEEDEEGLDNGEQFEQDELEESYASTYSSDNEDEYYN